MSISKIACIMITPESSDRYDREIVLILKPSNKMQFFFLYTFLMWFWIHLRLLLLYYWYETVLEVLLKDNQLLYYQ
jgi:hypothetical protein